MTFVAFLLFFTISLYSQDSFEIQSIVISSKDTLGIDKNGAIRQYDVKNVIKKYDLISYHTAYPTAKTFKGRNCHEIVLANKDEYPLLIEDLIKIKALDEVITVKDYKVNCLNPVIIDDPGILISEGYYIDMAKLPCAWDITMGDSNIIIAIPDIYFDNSHDDLDGKLYCTL